MDMITEERLAELDLIHLQASSGEWKSQDYLPIVHNALPDLIHTIRELRKRLDSLHSEHWGTFVNGALSYKDLQRERDELRKENEKLRRLRIVDDGPFGLVP